MPASLYHGLAGLVLLVHLLWIAWVAVGFPLARKRPMLRWFHLGSLTYAAVITLTAWPCPLTIAEQRLLERAGLVAYRGDFLVHYLDALVYPDLPPMVIAGAALAVCAVNLALHAREWMRPEARLSRAA